MRDYYAVLRVEAGATPEEIHRAYRTLAFKFHPDHNATPEAAATMVLINEAYAVLGEVRRRRDYDRSRIASRPGTPMALPILAAARDAVLAHRWPVLQDEGANLLLEKARRRMRVVFIEKLTNAGLRQICRRTAEFSVVLAVEIETPLNLALQIAVIDLVHSRHLGAPFPDVEYRTLFQQFIR